MLGRAMRIVTVCTLACAICADRARKTPKTVPSKAWTNRRLLAKSLFLGASVQAASGFVPVPHSARGLGRPAGVRPHEPLKGWGRPAGVRPHEPLKGWGRPAGVRPHEPLKGWGLDSIKEARAAAERLEGEELEEAVAALVEDEVESWDDIRELQKMISSEKEPKSPDVAGDADTAGELLIKIQKQKEQTNLGGDSELPKLRTAIEELKELKAEYLELSTADGKKAPISLNAEMDDVVTLGTRLINGDADLRDELLTEINKELKDFEADEKKAPNSLNAAMDDPVTLETMLITDDIAGDPVLRDERLAQIQEQKAFEAEYTELRTADAKKTPNSLNAEMDDLVTLETMLINDLDGKRAPDSLTAAMGHLVTLETMLRNDDIAGDADLRDELLIKIKEQKGQTNLDGESE